MSSRMPFRSNDDEARAAVSPLLDSLRSELLVMPREEVVEHHLEMMAFEEQLLATPRFVKTRAALPRPRRAAFALACMSATIAGCGLSAAGALPTPLQKITDSIARTLGVPEPHQDAPAPSVSGGASAPKATPPAKAAAPRATPTTPTTPKVAVPNTKGAHKPVTSHSPTTIKPRPSGRPLPTQPKPLSKPRPEKPSRRVVPKDPIKPSKNSDNTPPGYPKDWRTRAVAAATTQLRMCAQSSALAPANCPQVATIDPTVQAVQWTLLNNPQTGAAVIALSKATQDQWGNPSRSTTVTVYERYQMDASYTAAEGSPPSLAYSAGIGQATMTWNGTAFVNVSFTSGSAVGQLLPGVKIPALVRPVATTDASALAAVQTAFTGWLPAGTQLSGDPTTGAVVSFDGEQGTFSVQGTYAATSDAGPVGSTYSATLFYDGVSFQVLGITAP